MRLGSRRCFWRLSCLDLDGVDSGDFAMVACVMALGGPDVLCLVVVEVGDLYWCLCLVLSLAATTFGGLFVGGDLWLPSAELGASSLLPANRGLS